ncbi:MAG: APC family permease [Cryobacterium sp.]|nr:APC family permease [Oligoflexia bacterium]
MIFEQIKRRALGNPLMTEMAHHERIPKWKALAVLSSDALSSVAYATEEILIPLSLFAAAAVAWSIPIALAIGALLFIITVSYRQTIDAYPGGGGAYTVAKENLGITAGLVAGASLLIDYTLTVSVSVAAGVENIASAFPSLGPHKVILGVLVILLVMLLNLRGIKESSNIFAIPTYLFIGSFLVLIVVGGWRIISGDVPPAAPVIHEVYPAVPLFLLLRAFSSGCSALTGVEAISNGIPIFTEPSQKNAKATMLWMSTILGAFFLGITLLAHVYGVVPGEGQTAVSLLARQVFGNSKFYYAIPSTTALILFLAANTSYADFPRLASLLAKDRFLPRQLASLGDRLVFSNGIVGLSLGAIFLIIVFGGTTHHLIPLYAVGVFLSFTLSQVGMVVHHWRIREPGWIRSTFFNALGGLSTFVVLLVIGATKFLHGAWMVALLIPLLVVLFRRIKRHYVLIGKQLAAPMRSHSISITAPVRHTAIVPVSGLHPGVLEALRYATTISADVRACYIDLDSEATLRLKGYWEKTVPNIPLTIIKSPYRSVIAPIIEYVERVRSETHNDTITVIVPEFVTPKWYHQFLHNQTALVLRAVLRGRENTVVTSVRYHLEDY